MNKRDQQEFNKRVVELLSDIVYVLAREEVTQEQKDNMFKQAAGLAGLLQP